MFFCECCGCKKPVGSDKLNNVGCFGSMLSCFVDGVVGMHHTVTQRSVGPWRMSEMSCVGVKGLLYAASRTPALLLVCRCVQLAAFMWAFIETQFDCACTAQGAASRAYPVGLQFVVAPLQLACFGASGGPLRVASPQCCACAHASTSPAYLRLF